MPSIPQNKAFLGRFNGVLWVDMALAPQATLEAILFAAGESMHKKRLAALFEVSVDVLQQAIDELASSLNGRGLTLIETNGEVELRTSPDASAMVKKLRESELSRDLGKAGLEALAIILYQNGATRGQIDWVRGVNSAAAVRSLLLRGLVERIDDPADKRRAKYLPTVDALAHLGVSRIEELPQYGEYAKFLDEQRAASEEPASPTES
jgi:segregation and condensation protein B